MTTLAPIVNDSREGDFVHQGQTMAADDGFKNVSKIWYDQTISFEAGHKVLTEARKSRVDILCKPCDMVPYFDNGVVGFQYKDGQRFKFTEHAACQYGTRTDICHTYIKQNLNDRIGQSGEVKRKHDVGDMETLYRVFLNGHRHMNHENKYLWRTYTEADGSKVMRACLTQGYAIIDNMWYLSALEEVVPDGRLSHFNFSSADTMYGNLLIPDTIRAEKDSEYGGMVSLSNCEIGTRRNEETPGTFRAICMNGCIWGLKRGESRSQVHRGKIDLLQLKRTIHDNINKQIPLIGKRIDMLLDTRTWKIDSGVKVAQILTYLADMFTLRGQDVKSMFEEYNKNTAKTGTAFDVIDALTRSSQRLSADKWVDVDSGAADIIMGGQNNWNRINNAAREIKEEQLEALLKA